MLENSLRIRQRFISKLANKINELNSDIVLLNKVDRKISRSSRLQRGGAGSVDLKELQKDALIKRLQIEKQNEDLAAAISQAKDLTSKVTEINGALTQIKDDISKISVAAVDLTGIDVPDVNAYDAKVLAQVGLYALTPLKIDSSGELILEVAGVDGPTLLARGHTAESYKTLLSDAINAVFGLAVTSNDLDNLRRNLKADKIWADIADTASALVAEDAKKNKYGITEKVYTKLRTNNPAAAFSRKYFW